MRSEITFIQWNISNHADPEKVVARLKKEINGPFFISLMEITPPRYEKYRALFDCDANIAYSLDYRPPGKYDTMKRKLGVLFIAGNGVSIMNPNVMNRTLFPDRTLLCEFSYKSEIYRAASIHSITGCDHYKAKSVNFLSCAEEVDAFRPDIVTIDANEPNIDHYDVARMEFYDNGKGAEVLFNMMDEQGLKDSYSIHYDKSNYKPGKPLAISHVITPSGRGVRYDFAFINARRLKVKSSEYILDKTIAECKADHAMILVRAVAVG